MITYAYGALAPTQGLELLRDQLCRANRYRNALIALRRHERERAVAARRDEELGDNWIKATHWRCQETERALRKASGLGWGTYMLVEASVKQSRSSKGEMSFRRSDGTGRVAVPVPTSGKRWTNTWHPGMVIGELDGRRRTTVKLRVMGDEWIELPVVMHRPLPVGVIAQVYVTVERVGTRWVYGLRVVSQATRERAFGSGRVAINFGWRVVGDGVRVAVAVSDDGEVDELIIPLRILGACRHSESLRSIGDKAASEYFGDSRRRTRMRGRGLAHPAPATPWPENRESPWVNLRHWALQDRHLYQWERDEYRKAIRRRRAVVLDWVNSLSRRFGCVTVERYSLANLIRRDAPSRQEILGAKHIRFLVAPGELRSTVARVFGDRLEKLRVAKRTTVCHECGSELVGDRASSVVLTCEGCSALRDQDINNALNQQAAE